MECVVPLWRCFCLSPPELRHRLVNHSRRQLHLSPSSSFASGRHFISSSPLCVLINPSFIILHALWSIPGRWALSPKKNRFLSQRSSLHLRTGSLEHLPLSVVSSRIFLYIHFIKIRNCEIIRSKLFLVMFQSLDCFG